MFNFLRKKPKPKVFSGDEINLLFDIIQENKPLFKEHKYSTITKEMIEKNDYFDGEESLFQLDGYKVKYTTYGSHKTDGQLVDYYFTFKSPNGWKTDIFTEMCLMVGWNQHEDIEIL